MAERALLARERGDGRYEVASARWGGADRAVAAVSAGTAPRDLPWVRWARRDSGVEFADLVGKVDYLSTAVLYRVCQGAATVFCPLWFGLPLPSARPSPGVGGLVEVGSLPDLRALREWFRALKGNLADALVAGAVPAAAVPLALKRAILTMEGRERYVVAPATGEGLYPNEKPDGP